MLVSFKWMKFCRKNQGVWHLAALGCNPSGGTNNPTKQSLIRSFWTAGLSMKMMEDRFPTSPPAQRGSSLEPEPPWFPHQSTRSSRLSFISAAASWAAFIVHPSAAAFSIIDFEHQHRRRYRTAAVVSCLEYWGSSPTIFRYELWPHPPASCRTTWWWWPQWRHSSVGGSITTSAHISAILLEKNSKKLREGRQFPSIKKVDVPRTNSIWNSLKISKYT